MKSSYLGWATRYDGRPHFLPDTELDVMRMAARLPRFHKFDSVKTLLGHQASLAAILDETHKHVESLDCGDSLVLGWSTHGTQYPDPNEPDGYGEAIVCDDYNGGMSGLLTDDMLRAIALTASKKGVHVTAIADCCQAGGLARSLLSIKFLNNPDVTATVKTKGIDMILTSGDDLDGVAYMMACQEGESAISTGSGGVFTNAFLKVYELMSGKTTRSDMMMDISTIIASIGYQQHPRLICPAALTAKQLFE